MSRTKHKILYIGVEYFDYLSDSLLIGLKSIETIDVFEYFPNKWIYKDKKTKEANHGRGFTLTSVIDPNLQKLHDPGFEISLYDLIIFSAIKSQLELFKLLKGKLSKNKTILIDGSDSSSIVPFQGNLIKKPGLLFKLLGISKYPYYKREYIPNRLFFSKCGQPIQSFFSRILGSKYILKEISFSIPESKLLANPLPKTKMFPTHIVDEEIASKFQSSKTSYVFNTEEEYYEDLAISKFGITTKRAGWDCMRHYEIAANGAVICFKNLNQKPKECAPHGLIPNVNCINYSNYSDLLFQINSLSDESYNTLLFQTKLWISQYTCEKLVNKILNEVKKPPI